jgi:hypothetical protein
MAWPPDRTGNDELRAGAYQGAHQTNALPSGITAESHRNHPSKDTPKAGSINSEPQASEGDCTSRKILDEEISPKSFHDTLIVGGCGPGDDDGCHRRMCAGIHLRSRLEFVSARRARSSLTRTARAEEALLCAGKSACVRDDDRLEAESKTARVVIDLVLNLYTSAASS